MRKAAVIIDSRSKKELKETINRHMDYLPDWDLVHIGDTKFEVMQEYQMYMMTHNFWKRLEKYDKVLIFQCDTEILRLGVDEFLEYPYTYYGAPWGPNFPGKTHKNFKLSLGGNGGISLRDVQAHLKVTKNRKPRSMQYEDIWFCRNLPNVAPYEICRSFSVESMFELGTVCAHKIDQFLSKEECSKIRNQYNA